MPSLIRKFDVFIYYLEVAVKDSWRARTTLFTTATVFAGICLLLLVLIGLKRGLVAKLHDDIMTSWSSVRGTWYANNSNLSMDEEKEKAILAKLPRGSILIPEITKIVTLSTTIGKATNVTVQGTVPGDPFLRYHKAEIADPKVAAELIISPAIAKELNLSESSLPCSANIILNRGEGAQAVSATLGVVLKSIVGFEAGNSRVAYLHRHFMNQLEDFSLGEVVVAQGWPGLPVEDSVGVQGYLAFAKQPYSADDMNRLHLRGFKARLLSNDETDENSKKQCRLYGLLKPHGLHVYFLTTDSQNDRMNHFLTFEVSEVELITTSDEVCLYWSDPINAKMDNKDHRIVGVGGSLRWLKGYFMDSQVRFIGKNMNRVILPMGGDKTSSQLCLAEGHTLTLECLPASPEVQAIGALKLANYSDQVVAKIEAFLDSLDYLHSLIKNDLTKKWANSFWRHKCTEVDNTFNFSRQPIAFVPAPLLAAMHRYHQGSLSFDPTHQRFARTNTPNRYFSGLFYAAVLEDVPVIDETLHKLGYSTVSSRLRVKEMQNYARTLDLLVNILQGIAIILGIVTSSVLFMELTRRRQTSIGILRILGMDSLGIFSFVSVRAILIAIMGWIFATFVSLIISTALPPLFEVDFLLLTNDYTRVLLGSILCSTLGVIYHGYEATRLDPVKAIYSGKIQ